ncbi:MAG: SDR family NAD(P)-dependent oxidoreductase [Ruminococcaceae bacterium]|nr:SDR family NAD(P)-dependent oxidoreductase [Oscillospiraceae bacterium]
MKTKNSPVSYLSWLEKHTSSLEGKTVAVTGSTGGLGRELCRYLLYLGARLILVDRNSARAETLRRELTAEMPTAEISLITADLSDMDAVRTATEQLSGEPLDVFIHNAGAYSIPRKICTTGYDNVFQINFISPYYMIRKLMPTLAERQGRVVVVGSIAHNYGKADPKSIDFADRTRASKVYGNAKRYLMFSLYELFKDRTDVTLSVTHPGITFTGITAHYPKVIFAIIKHPMKVIFMKPKKAALSILRGIFEGCETCEWIGPRFFDVWGLPRKKLLKTCGEEERRFIGQAAEEIFGKISTEKLA